MRNWRDQGIHDASPTKGRLTVVDRIRRPLALHHHDLPDAKGEFRDTHSPDEHIRTAPCAVRRRMHALPLKEIGLARTLSPIHRLPAWRTARLR